MTGLRVTRHHAPLLVGSGLLGASFALGVVLRHNLTGTGLDQWFQRETLTGARRPGQPHFHHLLFAVLTRAQRAGTSPGIIYLAGAAFVVIIWFGGAGRSRFGPWRTVVLGLAPAVALAIAGGSAELLVKPVINRRMIGNESVLTYPSGHAVATAAIASATLIVLRRVRRTTSTQPSIGRWVVVGGLIAILPLAIGTDMAVLRAHFFTDVIGGWAWGCGWGCLVGTVGARWGPLRKRRAPQRSSMASA